MLLRGAGFAHATEQVYRFLASSEGIEQAHALSGFGGAAFTNKRNRKLYL
jgi:hypothetical protein